MRTFYQPKRAHMYSYIVNGINTHIRIKHIQTHIHKKNHLSRSRNIQTDFNLSHAVKVCIFVCVPTHHTQTRYKDLCYEKLIAIKQASK